MNIMKAGGVGESLEVSGEELNHICAQSRKKLSAKEVYTFCVRLCDNEVDRDHERFPVETLRELSALFVGKCGVFDHKWSAHEQVARIYRTELVQEESVRTAAGDTYCYLKGYAYMLRTESNRDLIAEIEGGIKKEVSVGCSVERAICSICGENMHEGNRCVHVKGRMYGGEICRADLRGATDAYEWSFVAVPAQKKAGVMKRMDGAWKELTQSRPELADEWETLEREAAVGRRYLSALRGEVVRLGGLAEPNLKRETMVRMVQQLEENELGALKKAYEERLEELYPAATQLSYQTEQRGAAAPDEMFRI